MGSKDSKYSKEEKTDIPKVTPDAQEKPNDKDNSGKTTKHNEMIQHDWEHDKDHDGWVGKCLFENKYISELKPCIVPWTQSADKPKPGDPVELKYGMTGSCYTKATKTYYHCTIPWNELTANYPDTPPGWAKFKTTKTTNHTNVKRQGQFGSDSHLLGLSMGVLVLVAVVLVAGCLIYWVMGGSMAGKRGQKKISKSRKSHRSKAKSTKGGKSTKSRLASSKRRSKRSKSSKRKQISSRKSAKTRKSKK